MGDIRTEKSQNLLESTGNPAGKIETPSPLDDLTLDREIVEKIVRDYNGDLDLISYEIEAGSSLGDGFTAVLLALKFLAKNRKNGGKIEQIQLMVKTLPKTEFRMKFLVEIKAFDKETRFYTEILKDFEEFQRSKGIPEEDMYLAYPKCYSAIIDGKKDYIAMENLKIPGYVLGDKRGLDMNHCKVTLKNLAKSHAISYAMFGGNFEILMKKYPFLKESFFTPPGEQTELTENFLKMFQQVYQMEKGILAKSGFVEESKIIDELDTNKLSERMNKLCSESDLDLYTIGMGDVWTNNMLFKYDSKGQILDHKFLDFQICRCCSRAVDLSYFIYTSVDMELNNGKHMTLLKTYFDEFASFAQKLGVPSEDLALDYDVFLQEYDDYRYYGFMMALMSCPMMFADKKDIPDMNQMDEEKMKSEDGCEQFFGEMMKGDRLTNKIKDMVTIHWPKVKSAIEKLDRK